MIVYTAPIKALSNQKFRDFREIHGDEVGIMTGDVTINPSASLLIMTTEVFRNTIFESPERLEQVSFVVFDEVHYLDDPERGTVWEESILYAPGHIRIVALSATIPNIEQLAGWIRQRFSATVYEDAFSPFCLIASSNGEADAIHHFLNDYCSGVPQLAVVRNDVYARFSHHAYNKGTALAELRRRLGVEVDEVFAAGDHHNDLPMLSLNLARWLAAPSNAAHAVKEAVRRQQGFVSQYPHGEGVADALEFVCRSAGREHEWLSLPTMR